jgi:hypothetical protein
MKLTPLTVTSVPAAPVAGERELRVALAMTVKVSETVLLPAVTVMVWAPAVVVGMVIVVIIIPLLRVTVSPDVGTIVVLSNLKVIAELAGKLEPTMLTGVPDEPELGDRGSRAAAAETVKVLETVVPLMVT